MTLSCLFAATIAAVAAADPSVPARQLAGGSDPDFSIVRIIAALAVCLAAAFGAVVALRLRQKGGTLPAMNLRRLGFTRPRAIDVVEARRLSQHADICLFRENGTEYLVLCGPAGFHVLRSSRIDSAVTGDAGMTAS